LACGVGIFLDCLRREGINAQGVERDERIARYARGMGLDVKTGDALEFLERSSGNYDGVYCSHFVEHLPVESVQELLEQFARTLAPGGVLVLVFPDPESIRSQLLGFWRDPEHVRFYHPELISAMAVAAGLELEWSSYDEQPHRVVPFSEDPPQIPQYSVFPSLESGAAQQRSGGLLDKIFRKLGLAQESQLRQLEARLGSWSEALQQESERQLAASRVLEERTSQLWDINRTWAWNDNVTLKLRKQAR
ncbi:MAG: SAM-dependent methyltransferase, partial [Bacteroidia bacterium]